MISEEKINKLKSNFEKIKYVISGLKSIIDITNIDSNFKNYINEYDIESYCFITAFNPFGKIIKKEENIINNLKLKKELSKFKIFDCKTKGKISEDGFLVINISINIAIEFQKKYNQVAILFGYRNKLPFLIYNENNIKKYFQR